MDEYLGVRAVHVRLDSPPNLVPWFVIHKQKPRFIANCTHINSHLTPPPYFRLAISEGLLGDKNSKFFLRQIRQERRHCNNNDVFITMSGFCAPKPFILTDSHCCTLMFCFPGLFWPFCWWQGSLGHNCIFSAKV